MCRIQPFRLALGDTPQITEQPESRQQRYDKANHKTERSHCADDGWVLCVALTADGRTAVSASWDNTLKVWDVQTGALRHTLAGHTDWVKHVALTADGRTAVSASEDKTLKVWDVQTGALRHSLAGHTDWVKHVALTADGRTAVSASWDNTLKVWDVQAGTLRHTLAGHTASVNHVALTADGRTAVSASDDKTLKVWDVEKGELWDSFADDDEGCAALLRAYPQVKAFAGFERAANGLGLSWRWRGSALAIHAADGALLARFYGDAEITAAAWSADGQFVVAGDYVGRVLLLRWVG